MSFETRGRREAWIGLAVVGLWAGCARQATQPDASETCTGPDCNAVCADGERTCFGQRAADCQGGKWHERTCEFACLEGRCVECFQGERRCAAPSTAQVCEEGRFASSDCEFGCEDGRCVCPAEPHRCTERGRERCQDDGTWTVDACPDDLPACFEGECRRCVPSTARCLDASTSLKCSATGKTEGAVHCPDGCDSASGVCFESCTPGQGRCRNGRTIERCADDGSRYVYAADCDVGDGGERCFEGGCRDTCADSVDLMSPAGCLFHGIPMDFPAQAVLPEQFGSDRPLTVFHVINQDPELEAFGELHQEGSAPTPFFIPPGESFGAGAFGRSVSVFNSHRVSGSVVTIRSSRSVYVVQHLDVNGLALAAPNNEESQSGDTAFLLPAHLIAGYGERYRILTQPFCTVATHPNHARPGGFTVVSTSSETTWLRVAFAAATVPGPSNQPPPYAPGSPADISLAPGEAIHLRAASGDLTGTLVESTRPVAVFNGGVSRIPCAGGHVQTQLLEQIMPVGLWGDAGVGQTHILGARQLSPLVGEEQWVALTDEPDNDLTFDPMVGGGVGTRRLVDPGDSHTVYTASGAAGDRVARDVTLESTKPVLVGRYYYVVNGNGGSTFTFERPVTFWRTQYAVRSVGAATNRILTVVPEGIPVELDGGNIIAPRRAATPGYEVLEIEVGRRVHHLSASVPFGLLVYGFTPNSVRDCYSYSGPVGFKDGL